MDIKINFAHPLTVTKFPVFLRYVKENIKDIKKEYYPQLLLSGAVSLIVSPICVAEDLIYGRKMAKSEVKSPLFILGHWRSGTTLLQQLLARDKQFGFVDPVMSFTLNFYHLLSWAFRQTIIDHLQDGRAMDNIKYAIDLPFEEYIIFSTIESNSVYPLNFFPQAFLKYNKLAFVDKMPEKMRKKWMNNYDKLLKKVTYLNDGKSLLLKSPDNTARMRAFKEKYPDAKFVNIYRDPYTVIRSTKHLYEKMFPLWGLEEIPDEETMEDWIIETFKQMYENLFEEQKNMDPDSFFEIKFEDFEKDPMPYLEQMYKALGIGGFDKARNAIEAHWNSQSGYKKNDFEYPERLLKKVNERLGFYFEHYGYEMKTI